MSSKQFLWLTLIGVNGLFTGINYIFPVFGQYQPRFTCADNTTAGACVASNCTFYKTEYQPIENYETIDAVFLRWV